MDGILLAYFLNLVTLLSAEFLYNGPDGNFDVLFFTNDFISEFHVLLTVHPGKTPGK